MWWAMDGYLSPYPDEGNPTLARELLFLLCGVIMMLLVRVFLWNSGIQLDPWYAKTRTLPKLNKKQKSTSSPYACLQKLSWVILGRYSIAFVLTAIATCGAIAGWIGVWNVFVNYHVWAEDDESISLYISLSLSLDLYF